jgi:hypothetical protein
VPKFILVRQKISEFSEFGLSGFYLKNVQKLLKKGCDGEKIAKKMFVHPNKEGLDLVRVAIEAYVECAWIG